MDLIFLDTKLVRQKPIRIEGLWIFEQAGIVEQAIYQNVSIEYARVCQEGTLQILARIVAPLGIKYPLYYKAPSVQVHRHKYRQRILTTTSLVAACGINGPLGLHL